MSRKLRLLMSLVLLVGIGGAAFLVVSPADAGLSSGVEPEPFEDPERISPDDEFIIRATLRIETRDGRAAQVPPGSRIVVTGPEGDVCLEFPLSDDMVDALAAGETVRLRDIAIPLAETRPGCGVPLESILIVLQLPDGSQFNLMASPWTPGAVEMELVIGAPIDAPNTVLDGPEQLPRTGFSAESGDAGGFPTPVAVVGLLAIGMALLSLRALRMIAR
jgi:hypothetical protein